MRPALLGTTFIAVALTASLASAEIKVTFEAGQVSVSAQNATASQILAEWARVGNARIVNAERVPGAPLTLEISHMPEQQALEILLRTAGGYLLAPRAVPTATLAKYDRILIAAVSSAPMAARPPVQTAATAPTFQPARPAFVPAQAEAGQSDPTPGQPALRAPAFAAFPQAPQPAPQNAAGDPSSPPAPTPSPVFGAGAAGVKFPGMAMPAPAPQPGARGANPGPPQ